MSPARRYAVQPSRTGHATRRARPSAEALEPRTVLSTFTVSNLNDDGVGSLRAAITAANLQPGADSVAFAGGLAGTVALLSPLTISGDLTVQGPGSNRLTLSGGNQRRILEIVGGGTDVELRRLTLANGRATEGGAIHNAGALILNQVVLAANTAVGGPAAAGRGGAVFNAPGGTVIASASTFSANRALGVVPGGNALGGALYNSLGGTARIVGNTTFVGNHAVGADGGTFEEAIDLFRPGEGVLGSGFGGAIANHGGTLIVQASTFRDNHARGGADGVLGGRAGEVGAGMGGAVFSVEIGGVGGDLAIETAVLSGNSARGGDRAVGAGARQRAGRAAGGGIAV